MKCTCGKECVLKENQFYLQGKYFTGYVCHPCNALYVNEEDSIFEYEKKLREKIR